MKNIAIVAENLEFWILEVPGLAALSHRTCYDDIPRAAGILSFVEYNAVVKVHITKAECNGHKVNDASSSYLSP